MSINCILVSQDPDWKNNVRSALVKLPLNYLNDCSSIKQCLDVMQENPTKMIIVDLFLKGTSGLDVIKALKQADEGLLALLLSRVRTRATFDKAFRFGANDVLDYPVDKQVLCETVYRRLVGLMDEEEQQAIQASASPEETKKA